MSRQPQQTDLVIDQINRIQEFIRKIEKRQANRKLVGALLLLLASGSTAGLSYGYYNYNSQLDDMKEQFNSGNCTTNGYDITREGRCEIPFNSTMISEICTFLCKQIFDYSASRHLFGSGLFGIIAIFLLGVWFCCDGSMPRNATNMAMNPLDRSIREFFNQEFGISLPEAHFRNDSALITVLRHQLQNIAGRLTDSPAITRDEKISSGEAKGIPSVDVELEPLINIGITASKNATPGVASPTPRSPSYLLLD